jgi:hypothetical protein
MGGHRFQILLDDERYERVTSLARDRKVSVAAVIREAIDRGLPAPPRRRAAAFRRILVAEPMPVSGPVALRAELDESRGRHGGGDRPGHDPTQAPGHATGSPTASAAANSRLS